MKNRKVALAISAGIKEKDFKETWKYKVTIEQLIQPFKTSTTYINSNL